MSTRNYIPPEALVRSPDAEIASIDAWPPGSLMRYDNLPFCPVTDPQYHQGLGLVVANDGGERIKVLWDSHCDKQLVEYRVGFLNHLVISHVK